MLYSLILCLSRLILCVPIFFLRVESGDLPQHWAWNAVDKPTKGCLPACPDFQESLTSNSRGPCSSSDMASVWSTWCQVFLRRSVWKVYLLTLELSLAAGPTLVDTLIPKPVSFFPALSWCHQSSTAMRGPGSRGALVGKYCWRSFLGIGAKENLRGRLHITRLWILCD